MAYSRTLTAQERYPMDAHVGASRNSYARSWTFTGTRSGSKVENYKELIAKGLPASSPYALDMTRIVPGLPEKHFGAMQAKAWPYQVTNFGCEGHPGIQFLGGNTLAHLGVDRSKARSMALSKLYKKLESDRSEMNAAASIAEIGDVLRQFGRPFGSIVDAFMRHENRLIFEKRRLVGSKTWKQEKFASIAAETWLEVSFGLLPLISDAESLAKALGRWQYELSDSPKLRDRMRTRAVDTLVTMTGPYTQGYLNVAVKGMVKVVTEARAQYVVGLSGDVRADFGSNDRLLELLGLEPRNIPLAIWEAVPWSWLVDYGTNVQQILQAGATITSRVKWVVLTEVTRTEQSTETSAVPSIDYGSYKLLNFVSDVPPRAEQRGMRMIRTTLNRTLPTTLGVPPLYFKTPIGEMKKMANLLAIAVTRSKDRTTWLS